MANMLNFVERVPPLEKLLANGIPSVSALDTFIADLDVNLEENAKELDGCMKDMLKISNAIVGKEYITPRDALLSMISTHSLEKDSCYDPEPDAVTEILSHASLMLDKVPGCEEAVFQDLLSLSSEQGLSLPLRTTAVDPVASTLSLNAVSDSSEVQIAQQWDQIALRLRKYFQDKLMSLPVSPCSPSIDVFERRRLKYVQSLMTLQPVNDVWDRYQVIRRQQLEQCLSLLMPENESENLDILKLSENCTDVARVIIQMMNEDFTVLNTGILKKTSSLFHAFRRTYLDKFSDEMSALIDEVTDEIRESFQKRGASQSFSTLTSKRKSKSSSSKTGANLHQAQSMESVAGGAESPDIGHQQIRVIPLKYTEVMLNIVKTLQLIEEHLDCLQKAAIWDFGGISAKKLQRKGSLKGVLKPSSSPDLTRRPNSANMSSIDSDTYMSDMMSSYGSTGSNMADPLPPGPKVTVIEKMKLEERIKWDWKFIFKRIKTDLTQTVEAHIKESLKTCLETQKTQWSLSQFITTITIDESLWGGRLDYPKVISKAIYDIMLALEKFLVLAKSGNEGVLQAVKTSYIESVSNSLKDIHDQLLKMSDDIPIQSPMKNLYVILSSAAYIRNHLLHFDNVLSPDDSKRCFAAQYKIYVELVEKLTNQVIHRHKNYIATSVLHDADSHNWTDMKEFYEDERCSFSIQMWCYYLRGIQNDFWSICPPKLSQTSFSVILHDSLQILAQRYTKAKPSFRRITQFCCDIKTILLCVSELLYPCSNSISKCLDVSHNQIPHYSIHNLCIALLSTLTVIASPLDLLYKVNKKGFRYRQKRKSTTERGNNCDWLSWIQPHWIDRNIKSYDDMRTTTAMYLHTKLLLSQPEISYPLTLQAYFMKDFSLSILFLTQATGSITKTTELESSHHPSSPRSVDYLHRTPVITPESVRKFTLSLFRVLIFAQEFNDGLTKVVVPVIDRCDEWSCLDIKHVPGRDMEIPIWMEGVFECLKPFVHRVLKPVIEFVLSQSESKHITPLSSVLEELPCGCRTQASSTTPRSFRKSEADKDTVDAVLRLVLHQMTEDMFVIPTSVCVLFKTLDTQCGSKGLKTPHHCAGTKLLALALRDYLMNTERLIEDIGVNISPTVTEELKMLADCIYHVMVSGKVKGSSTPRLAGRFCKENKDWINDKIQILVYYLRSEIFDVSDNCLIIDGTTEFTDQFYISLSSDILSTTHGLEDVQLLYWLLYNNSHWLHGQLDIKHVLPLVSPGYGDSVFTMNVTPHTTSDFNPIIESQCIGPYRLDHVAIETLTLDWEKLLQSDLGLSELGFRTLLYNRHEMQDGAYIEENEKKPVANLRAIFENDPRELR
ncbi:hypothetical protein ACF0H5_013526 [Mactra antiquata]